MKDAGLAERLVDGDAEALRQVYHLHKHDLLTVATAILCDLHAAEDRVHDVFAQFAGGVKDVAVDRNLRGYLMRCVANRAKNMLKQRRVRRSRRLAQANQPEEVYLYRTEKWASHAGYIDMTYEQDGAPVLQVCYHFDSGTITVTYHWLKQYYRLQVPQAYRDRLRGVGPVGLIETLFQSGDAKRWGPESVGGRDAVGFEVSNVAQRLDETVSPSWVRFFFVNLKESKVRLWIDPETRLPLAPGAYVWHEIQ